MVDVKVCSRVIMVRLYRNLSDCVASVRCLQIEDSIVATGSSDATIRIWDLTRAETYANSTQPATSVISSLIHAKGTESDSDDATDGSHQSRPQTPQYNSTT